MKYDLRKCLLLYAVTDRRWLKKDQTLAEAVSDSVAGGVTMVQLREKNMPENEVEAEAIDLKKILHKKNIPLIIDNNVKICQKVEADGVHLGQDDMPVKRAREILGNKYIIGATAHNVSEAIKAEKDGADYLGVGAAFGSSTKTDAKKIISLSEYVKITNAVSIPVVAIGGIDETNILQLNGAGLSGVAVVSAIYDRDDIKKASREMRKLAEQL